MFAILRYVTFYIDITLEYITIQFAITFILHGQFVDKWGMFYDVKTILLEKPQLRNDTNNYLIKSFENYTKGSSFGIQISFERNTKGTIGILINYHFMCATLVLVANLVTFFQK